MEKQLEVIAFGAIPFIIDRNKLELKQFNKPENIIRFDELKKEEGYYLARFDNKTSYLSTVKLEFNNHSDKITDIYIPAPIIDSPISLTADFKQDLNISSHHKSWGFYLGDKDTACRLSGVLPHIDLAGTDFTVDWRLKQMRETELPWKHISFDNLEMDESGEAYLCFFNTENHEVYIPEEDITEMPQNVVVLEIPYELKLDPVAVARASGLDETELLLQYPIQPTLAAKVIPLSESGLPEFIENNLKKQVNNPGDEERNSRRGR
jgi:hypothetical protein